MLNKTTDPKTNSINQPPKQLEKTQQANISNKKKFDEVEIRQSIVRNQKRISQAQTRIKYWSEKIQKRQHQLQTLVK